MLATPDERRSNAQTRRDTMRLAIPDLISNSYFPALAAAELGCFEHEGIDVSAELIFPADRAYAALRDGEIDFVGGAAHGALAAFPEWRGVRLLGALAQGMYWFLVMRADLGIARGDLAALRGRRIGAAPWVEMGLRRLLAAAGLDPAREQIEIAPVPGATGSTVNFGLTAAEALAGRQDRRVLGQRHGDRDRGDDRHRQHRPRCSPRRRTAGVLRLHDAGAGDDRAPDRTLAGNRRGSGARAGRGAECPETGRVARHRSRPQTLSAARGRADRRIVRRDLPFYDAAISEASVAAINAFARDVGVLAGDVPYDQIVATQFSHLWQRNG